MQKDILFSDIVIAGMDLFDALDKENQEEADKAQAQLNEYKQKLMIRHYVPLLEKQQLLIKILYNIGGEGDAAVSAVSQTTAEIVYGLIEGYTNIENDLMSTAMDDRIIDMLYNTDFIPLIEEHCFDDYQRLLDMVERTINWNNFLNVVDTMMKIDTSSIDKLTDTIVETREKLDKSTIKDLAKISSENDKVTAQFREALLNDMLERDRNKDYEALKKSKEARDAEKSKETGAEK